jgi:hypothetical protein
MLRSLLAAALLATAAATAVVCDQTKEQTKAFAMGDACTGPADKSCPGNAWCAKKPDGTYGTCQLMEAGKNCSSGLPTADFSSHCGAYEIRGGPNTFSMAPYMLPCYNDMCAMVS